MHCGPGTVVAINIVGCVLHVAKREQLLLSSCCGSVIRYSGVEYDGSFRMLPHAVFPHAAARCVSARCRQFPWAEITRRDRQRVRSALRVASPTLREKGEDNIRRSRGGTKDVFHLRAALRRAANAAASRPTSAAHRAVWALFEACGALPLAAFCIFLPHAAFYRLLPHAAFYRLLPHAAACCRTLPHARRE